MRDVLPELTAEVRELALREGAALFGVGSIDRFEGAPRSHHPAQMVKGAQVVVSVGIPILEQVSEWQELFQDSELLPPEFRNTMLQNYLYTTVNYDFVNDRLDQTAHCIARFLQSKGFRSLMFPATFDARHREFQDMIPGLFGLFSQRHAAVRAGLGEFGLNNVVVTPEYGPGVRFNSVITQAPLEPSPLFDQKACLGTGCLLCVEKCGGQALSLLPDFCDGDVWLNPVSRTDIPVCRKLSRVVFCTGRCIAVCPVGKHTSSDLFEQKQGGL